MQTVGARPRRDISNTDRRQPALSMQAPAVIGVPERDSLPESCPAVYR